MALAGGLAGFWSLVGTAHLVRRGRGELRPRGDAVEYLPGKSFSEWVRKLDI